MEAATLVLLGAAGGALRGLLDVYTRFLDWQADRRAHRLLPPEQQGQPPRFRRHFDPVGDPVAAVVHSGMGAAAAVLFGTTGQISGAYAALVVGMSAPGILTQLSRVQSVNDALTAPVPAQPTAEQQTPEPVAAAEPLTAQPTAVNAGQPAPAPTVLPEPRAAQTVFMDGDGTQTQADVRQASHPPHTTHPHPNGRPADTAPGPGREHGGREAPPRSQRPVVGEEGAR
ncbi:hypothetical protein [Streptomyces sp. MMG1533]|uniref:hypothetical protein n=1 Tax=Streptomyces sp. MMG1533 TaxID=1415546 RepID=UPI0018FEB41D|nr:hypothetical protein [Streptomyces sp. MMG1533]